MKKAYFEFMSAMDIDCYKSIRESDIGNTLPYSDIVQLFIIGHKDNITVSELAEKLNLSRPATTQKVNELVNKKLVVKIKNGNDKRTTYLKLSESLKNSSNNAKASLLIDKVDQHFSKEKKEIFKEVLSFMTSVLTGEVDGK